MDIKKYRGKYPSVARYLYERGALRSLPFQIKREDLEYDEGIDIVYRFRNMTPERFRELSEALLLAAYTEAERYAEEKYKFVRVEVELNRTAKGRRTINPRRDYIAAKHTDSEVLVYGEEALGAPLPEEYRKRPYLINKFEEIMDIPDTPSPGAYVKKQRPYKVISMVISIRAGLRRAVRIPGPPRTTVKEGLTVPTEEESSE